MAYQRFLTNNDYLALVTQEGLDQLIRGDINRLAQAEQRAEMKIVDYLDQFYEIGKELDKGKRIKDYANIVTYPSGVFFKKDGKIWRTITSMNACHEPTSEIYWENTEDLVLPAEQLREEKNKILPYLQLKTYNVGDVVSYLGSTWKCIKSNGWDYKNIQIPGIKYWDEVETPEWIANYPYEVGQVVKYKEKFYMVVPVEGVELQGLDAEGGQEETEAPDVPNENVDDGNAPEETPEEQNPVWDWSDNPEVNMAFGLIGNYDKGYNYTVDAFDYVVKDNKVFLPVLNPNADDPKENVNIVVDDCRNYNLVNYMTSIALYYLNALIAPTNISQARIDMFNEAIIWIEGAARMKLDPHIPRKIERDTHTPKDDWAMASFETDMATQLNSPWFI